MTRKKPKPTPLGMVVAAGLAMFGAAAPARADAISDISANLTSMSDLVFGNLRHITVGLGPKFGPDYLGSNDYELKPDLSLNVRFGDRLSADASGVDFALFGIQRVTFGPTLHLSGRRGPHTNPALEGLGRVKRSPEVGAFAKALWPDQLSLRFSVRQGIARGHEGTLVELEGSAQVFRSPDETLAGYVGAGTTWSSAPYARTFFGIDPGQSANSELPVYDPGSSMRDVSMSASLRWAVSGDWALNASADYSLLLADIARSPIVKDYGSPHQFSIGLQLAHTMRLN